MLSTNVYGLTRSALLAHLEQLGIYENPNAKARHIFREIYRRTTSGIADLKISARTLAELSSELDFSIPVEIVSAEASQMDGSVKMLVRTVSDGGLVESVLVPERGRLTQCVSTQVGCKQGCRFCQTGKMGFRRSLTTAEIVGQLVAAEIFRKTFADGIAKCVAEYPKISNVVYMGMGEPLDNVDATLASAEIFVDSQGLNLSPNKVTISSVGLLPELDTVLRTSSVAVALSVHSPFEEERTQLMPVNAKHPLHKIVDVLRWHSQNHGRVFFIQYMLTKDVNDTEAHAKKLQEIFAGVNVKINLIPLNEHEGAAFRRPDVGRVYAFQQMLKSLGFVATVRLSKGRDIQAACGQLVKKKTEVDC